MREAIAHHPQVSHVMLILALGASLTATCKIGSLRSYWLALIFALDFIEAYLVSHLAEYLYLNWPQMAEIPYPSSIRYQLLYDLGPVCSCTNWLARTPLCWCWPTSLPSAWHCASGRTDARRGR